MASNMDREMILADFQACTGIENIDEAITLLEQNNWDLVPEQPRAASPGELERRRILRQKQ